jgi:predicted phosphoserine aminotransferase
MNPVLFIPGPTEVAAEVLKEMSRPAIGHRSAECARLWKTARAGLRNLMHTDSEVLILTGPASAMMEAAVRNTVHARSLHLVNGAFSRRWYEIAKACGKDAILTDKEWGQGFTARDLAAALGEHGPVDAVTVVHNETSTGTTSPIQGFRSVLEDHPQTLLLVDTVSSMGGVPVHVDEWELDVCLFGVQKCMALPAGIAVASVSARAMERANQVEDRGWFLDFVRLAKSNEKEQSPTTPSTAHLYALVRQLERIEAEGLDQRWERHAEMATRTREWAEGHAWRTFPDENFRSDTVSCIARAQGPDFNPVIARLAGEGLVVSGGYGQLKGETFRIGHMGEHTIEDLERLLDRFDALLELQEDSTS